MPPTRISAGPRGVHKLIWLLKLFNYGLHLDTLLMCLKGGFGFHVAEIIVRFGPDVLTFFFKVGLACSLRARISNTYSVKVNPCL